MKRETGERRRRRIMECCARLPPQTQSHSSSISCPTVCVCATRETIIFFFPVPFASERTGGSRRSASMILSLSPSVHRFFLTSYSSRVDGVKSGDWISSFSRSTRDEGRKLCTTLFLRSKRQRKRMLGVNRSPSLSQRRGRALDQ